MITATTFIMQIFGPIGVKFAIHQAAEIGKARHLPQDWVSEGPPRAYD